MINPAQVCDQGCVDECLCDELQQHAEAIYYQDLRDQEYLQDLLDQDCKMQQRRNGFREIELDMHDRHEPPVSLGRNFWLENMKSFWRFVSLSR